MSGPVFWIIAGPNGAGKTTLVQSGPISQVLADVTFLNPDDVTLAMLQRRGYRGWSDVPDDLLREVFIDAANEVFQQAETLLAAGTSVGVETVLSTHKYQPLVESLQRMEGQLGLVYVSLAAPSISQARIRHRVSRGGHDVPAEKLAERWRRSLENLEWYLRAAAEFWVFDNSDSKPDVEPPLLAYGQSGTVIYCTDDEIFPEMESVLRRLPRDEEFCDVPDA